jgi:RNA polymerase sigma factor (sigma-70 family)
MRHARDDEDTRLVESQDYARLLAAYYPVVVERCRLRVPGQDAYDVAHAVVERLIHELRRGKRYAVPFRVVVHNVTRWKIAEFHTSGRVTFELDEDGATAPDELQAVEDQYSVELLLEDLPEGTRRVFELRYLEGLEHEVIAERLGMERNAVDQALHRGHKRLRELIHG